MYRCVLAGVAAAGLALGAGAQTVRHFPADALRGTLVVGDPPEATLNGQPARLAPAARIRAQNNMLVLSGSISGAKLLVHYTLDLGGQLKDVWVLRPEEAALRPWPTSTAQAQAWVFDPVNQVWSKP